MSYVPREYWFERGKRYMKEFRPNKKQKLQERILLDYLKDIHSSYSPFSKVLEVGCGFGRVTKLLLANFPNIVRYTAIDLSPDQIENAKAFVKPAIATRQYDPLNFVVSDIQSFESESTYDLVISCEVLLHVLPSDIEKVMMKLVALSKEHVINIDWYEKRTPRNAAPHNFIHQYEKIYRGMPTVSNVYRTRLVERESWLRSLDTKQSLFHAHKRNKT